MTIFTYNLTAFFVVAPQESVWCHFSWCSKQFHYIFHFALLLLGAQRWLSPLWGSHLCFRCAPLYQFAFQRAWGHCGRCGTSLSLKKQTLHEAAKINVLDATLQSVHSVPQSDNSISAILISAKSLALSHCKKRRALSW